jgi:hypothetical protein
VCRHFKGRQPVYNLLFVVSGLTLVCSYFLNRLVFNSVVLFTYLETCGLSYRCLYNSNFNYFEKFHECFYVNLRHSVLHLLYGWLWHISLWRLMTFF